MFLKRGKRNRFSFIKSTTAITLEDRKEGTRLGIGNSSLEIAEIILTKSRLA